MKPKHFYAFSTVVLFTIFHAVNIDAQCCRQPDTLKVKNVADSSFCLKWHVNDSLNCDSAKAFQIQYRPVNTTVWTSVVQFYHHDTVYVFCDTGTACVKYEWKVRNACLHSGDTILSSFVTGPKFTLDCHSGNFKINSNLTSQDGQKLLAQPNPARNNLLLCGYFSAEVKITITKLNGTKVFEKTVSTQNGRLNFPIDVTSFENGLYIITLVDNRAVYKTNFLKE